MGKRLKLRALVLGGLVTAAGVFVVASIVWFVWQLHPWMAPGRASSLGHWQFPDCEFQVWQRKNLSVLEPFADGLFVRQGANQWEAFCFDIQDSYSPTVKLQKEGSQVFVYRGREKRGVYDLTAHTFLRHEQPFTAVYISSDPPGDWWVSN